ncbi:MAG: hypothetical protein JWN76_3330 [Chitinophagaceae bacterium]|nr:hypothetical protein [Chitinophagaceae bacterium]
MKTEDRNVRNDSRENEMTNDNMRDRGMPANESFRGVEMDDESVLYEKNREENDIDDPELDEIEWDDDSETEASGTTGKGSSGNEEKDAV